MNNTEYKIIMMFWNSFIPLSGELSGLRHIDQIFNTEKARP